MHRNNKLSTHQKGFTVVEGLLILVIVGIIGGVGWYVIGQKNKDQGKSTNQTTNKKSESNNNSQNQQYLVVKEWKVKLKVDSSLGKITYAQYSNDPNNQIVLNSDLQKTLPLTCQSDTSGWGIARIKTSELNEFEKGLPSVGGYSYKRIYPPMGCEQATAIMAKIDTAYVNMFTSLSANN